MAPSSKLPPLATQSRCSLWYTCRRVWAGCAASTSNFFIRSVAAWRLGDIWAISARSTVGGGFALREHRSRGRQQREGQGGSPWDGCGGARVGQHGKARVPFLFKCEPPAHTAGGPRFQALLEVSGRGSGSEGATCAHKHGICSRSAPAAYLAPLRAHGCGPPTVEPPAKTQRQIRQQAHTASRILVQVWIQQSANS